METLLSYLESNWPNITFYIVLVISVILSFKWIIKNVLDEYKALLKETRETNKNSIEEANSILNQYKERNSQINSEIKVLYERVENLNKQVNEREVTIKELQAQIHQLKNEFKDYNDEIKGFFSNQLKKKDYSDLKLNIKALFSERDRIHDDLELVWKSLLRFSIIDKNIEKELVGAKTERDKNIKKSP